MNRSLPLGTYAGIAVRVHWTFALLIGFLLISGLSAGQSLPEIGLSVLFILTLFACVVLHEFGHALSARMYGIPTRDITLLPIGGVARLARMPRKPVQELVVAIAGPAVNVVIAGLLLAVLLPTTGLAIASADSVEDIGFFEQLMWTNIGLVVFNMLPAFPMDGGRVLRALLAMFTDYTVATRIAARVGQVFAGLFALLGFYNPFMFLLALFIFFGAAAEARSVVVQEKLRGYTVADGMLRKFRTAASWLTLGNAAEMLLGGQQKVLPIVDEGQLVGLLTKGDMLRLVHAHGSSQTISKVMNRQFKTLDPNTQLLEVIEGNMVAAVQPVTEHGQLVGLLDLEVAADLIATRERAIQEEPILATLVDPQAVASSREGPVSPYYLS